MSKKEKALSKVYIGYIAYYIHNLGSYESRDVWKTFLTTNKYDENSEDDLRKIALKLYYNYVLQMMISPRINLDCSIKELQSMVKDLEEVFKKHDIKVPVLYYTSTKDIVEHMRKMQDSATVMDKILEEEKPKVTKQAVKKPAAKQATKGGKAAPKKTATKATGKKTVTSKATALTLAELRKMATEKQIPGRSQMTTKAELIKALKLK